MDRKQDAWGAAYSSRSSFHSDDGSSSPRKPRVMPSKKPFDRGEDQPGDAKHKYGQNDRRDRLKQPSRSRHKRFPCKVSELQAAQTIYSRGARPHNRPIMLRGRYSRWRRNGARRGGWVARQAAAQVGQTVSSLTISQPWPPMSSVESGLPFSSLRRSKTSPGVRVLGAPQWRWVLGSRCALSRKEHSAGREATTRRYEGVPGSASCWQIWQSRARRKPLGFRPCRAYIIVVYLSYAEDDHNST